MPRAPADSARMGSRAWVSCSMSTSILLITSRRVALCVAALTIAASGAVAQSGSTSPKAQVKVAMLDLAFYGARAVGKELGAQWVLMGKISKTSDLIWIFSGELIDVASGKLVLDDSYELKGIASDMVPKGAEVFARRVAKRVTAPDTAVVQ